jgi:TnpA family transposase
MGERVRGIDARPQNPRQNALAKALREIGRLERTLFTLGWISDPTLRRRANAGLNKGEARNALARRVLPSAPPNCRR